MELELDAAPTLKRTGRPVHPLWAHFHRGEKRNRYHYHAFCSYCMARHGVDHVPPTRGVSADMLRHLESCPHCPRNVLDTVQELCTRRERMTTARKNANGDSGNGTRLIDDDDDDKDHVLLLDAMAVSKATQTTAIPATRKRTRKASSMDTTITSRSSSTNTTTTTTTAAIGPTRNNSGQEADPSWAIPTTRGEPHAIMTQWRRRWLQTAVATRMPLDAFQDGEFQHLLQLVSPASVESLEMTIRSVGSRAFLNATAAQLARTQLEQVQENTRNSTIKSGLTLSVTCWCTLDLQHLVAFTLVNANGDAACVRVNELRGQMLSTGDTCDASSSLLHPAQLLPLARALEDVLLDLKDQHLCVMGIVADSATALSAAKRVCRATRWHSLLVVPCMSTLLTSLVGSVLTHEVYRDAVGQLVELAAYFTNSRLQASLRSISGEKDARIPLPTRKHWFSFVVCLTKVLHYSDVITALCTSQDEQGSALAPSALRKLVLDNNSRIWKILRGLAVLLAPLREAYSLMFQPNAKMSEDSSAYDNDDECSSTVRGGLTLAHVMYQLGRMSQQYAALADSADSADLNLSLSNNGEATRVVAHRLYELLDTMWQQYDLPTMVLAYVFDFHMDIDRLDLSNSRLQWKAVSSYFQHCFQRWFCQPQENQVQKASGSTVLAPISSNKVEAILNAYQHRQFPFDADTTSDYTDVSSFYSFVSDSHPEICALCCRMYAVALACVDLRGVIRGIGFVPSIAQTIERPEQVELLLHVGYATSLKKIRPPSGSSDILPELMQASYPEEILCSHQEWEAFSTDWKQFLDHEMVVNELEQLQKHDSIGSHQDKLDEGTRLSLNQLFFDVLPPFAAVVAPSPHDRSGAITQASFAL